MPKILSSEIISLVHHVKLNESGWWEKAMQNIIISIFGINGNSPLSDVDILNNVSNEINNNIDKIRVSSQLEILKGKQILIPFQENSFTLSENSFEEFKTSYKYQKVIEFEAEKRFNDLCNVLCPDKSSKTLWKDVNENLIIPLIREIGAKTYELISGEEAIPIEQYGQFANFIARFDGDRSKIQLLLLQYFDFKNTHVKKHLLHQLNAYFFVEATNLNEETVEKVYSLSKSQTQLKVFVDTNFLLTLLDLHDNPSNDASIALIELLDEIKNRVSVKFYVLPISIYEFKNLISKFKDYLKKLRPTLNQAIAAESSEDFSGIIKKYFQKCHEKGVILDVDDYFDPYLDNFTVNIRKRNLEIEQVNMEKYSTDQRVVDDLLEQVEYRYERILNQGKLKGLSDIEKQDKKDTIYCKFNHDCQLWYYVKDKRPAYIDSTKDIKNWIITLDFSFLEFDKYKQFKTDSNKISLCLHPNEFISMLQFWVPRTEKFENAILGNFRLPFLFKEVDNESEKVSLEILKAMSQYEDSEKFTSELVAEILTNKALRQKMKVNNTVQENAELIKEEVFKKYEATKQLLNQEKEKKENLTDELTGVKIELTSLTRKIDELQDKTNKRIEKELELIRKSKIQELNNQKDSLNIKKEQLKNRISDYDEQIKRADLELDKSLNSFGGFLKSSLVGKNKYTSEQKEKIHSKYYDSVKLNKLKKEFEKAVKDHDDLIIPKIEEKIIIYCENQNSVYFNKLKFQNIHFIPESDSSSVFIKTVANPAHFGLRDRDYLTDREIERLKKQYSNYLILDYYCFENYLFHPDNIEEIKHAEFNKEWYISELVKQKNAKYDKILLKLSSSRRGYQELKNPDNKFKENDEVICQYLKSNEIDIFLKSYSLKTEFDKSVISKFQLTTDMLSSTDWFRKRIEKLLSF